MSDDSEALVPQPKQVPEKLDEAFEVEKPNASVVVPDPAPLTVEDATRWMMGVLACEDYMQDIQTKKQKRETAQEVGQTAVDVTKWMAIGTIAWLIFVALCVVGYMIAAAFGLTVLPENALIALIASSPIPALINLITRLLTGKEKKKQISN